MEVETIRSSSAFVGPEWILVLVFLTAIPALIVAVVRYEKKRTAELKLFARRIGMEFLEKDPRIKSAPFQSFPLFQKGRSKKSGNVMVEEKGPSETLIFEYRYRTGGGKNSSTHTQTIVAFKKNTADLPAFAMGPEYFVHRIGEKFGMQDIDFSGEPVFSETYLLQGEDEPAVRRLFEGKLARFFARHPKWNVEGGGDWLLVYKGGKRPKVDEIPTMIKESIELARQFDMV